MSDLVGNPEDQFSHNKAQIIPECLFKEKELLEESLYQSQTTLEESKSYISQIRLQQKDDKRERARYDMSPIMRKPVFKPKSMAELSPFSIFLIISKWKLVNKISQEQLELGS